MLNWQIEQTKSKKWSQREKALINIRESKDVQKEIQDKLYKKIDKGLAAGTSVFLKKEGLLGKLEPRFDCPFTVAKQTQDGNYMLKDSEGKILPNSSNLINWK